MINLLTSCSCRKDGLDNEINQPIMKIKTRKKENQIQESNTIFCKRKYVLVKTIKMLELNESKDVNFYHIYFKQYYSLLFVIP